MRIPELLVQVPFSRTTCFFDRELTRGRLPLKVTKMSVSNNVPSKIERSVSESDRRSCFLIGTDLIVSHNVLP